MSVLAVFAVAMPLQLWLPTEHAYAQSPVQCVLEDSPITTVETEAGNWSIYREGQTNVVLFLGRMHVDADGSPRAYAPGDKGIDHLGNAQLDQRCTPADGTSCPLSEDVIEKKADGSWCTHEYGTPPTTYYTAMTSLRGGDFPACDPRRYVNAEEVPFLVLPGDVHATRLRAIGVEAGDYGFGFARDRSTPAIVADFGPSDELGEASMEFARRLGYGADPGYDRTHDPLGSGTERREVLYVVFPLTGPRTSPPQRKPVWPRPVQQIETEAQAVFETWGGLAKLQSCAAAVRSRP
jgi:Fungal chitosanase of glycosyl hydrolase group 75